jgi:hypothetical protein
MAGYNFVYLARVVADTIMIVPTLAIVLRITYLQTRWQFRKLYHMAFQGPRLTKGSNAEST